MVLRAFMVLLTIPERLEVWFRRAVGKALLPAVCVADSGGDFELGGLARRLIQTRELDLQQDSRGSCEGELPAEAFGWGFCEC